MPKFFLKIPFWLWPLVGLVSIALAIPSFIAAINAQDARTALAAPVPEIVDLEEFDQTLHVGAAREVNVFAQTNSEYRFVIDSVGGSAGTRYAVPLFSVMADWDEKGVDYLLLVDELASFDAWLEQNLAGNARLGDLYEVNGRIVDGQGYLASIRVTLRDAGLVQSDNLVIIEPFIAGRAAALGQAAGATFKTPIVLLLIGFWCLGLGWIVWHRGWKSRKKVNKRMGAMEKSAARPSVKPTEMKKPKPPKPVELRVVSDRAESAKAAASIAEKAAKVVADHKKSAPKKVVAKKKSSG